MTQENQVVGPQYLFFENNAQRFALDIRFVEEIVFSRPVVPAPTAPDYIEGVINLRGKIITMIVLGKILGEKNHNDSRSAVVILRMSNSALAFHVSEIVGIETLSSGSLGEVTLGDRGERSPVKAVFQHGGYPVNLLDMEQLISFIFEKESQG